MSIVTDDDVAVENSTYTTGRCGVAGTLIVKKMVGAALFVLHATGRIKPDRWRK